MLERCFDARERAARIVLTARFMLEPHPLRRRTDSVRGTRGERAGAIRPPGAEERPSFGRRALADRSLGWVVLLLVAGTAVTLVPLWAPLVLAAWLAIIARPLYRRMAARMHGKYRGAGVVTVLMVLAVLTPLAVVVLSLAGDAVALGRAFLESRRVPTLLQPLVETGRSMSEGGHRMLEVVQRHGGGALQVASTLAGATAAVLIGLFVFVIGFFTFLVDGERLYGWLLEHSPLRRRHTERLAMAFAETGRGLFIGVGATAALQGAVAAIGYVAVGVPHALVLGLLTAISALIPSIGSGLVWVPVAVVLGISGRTGGAIAILVVGCVVSLVDNVVRPLIAKYAELSLPTFVLFVAMLGGIAAFGAWGLLLGPLLVRLAKEGLTLLREEQARAGAG